MKIYTKKGDQGETGLFGGKRVKKTHGRIEAYGTLDELNSALGIVTALIEKENEARMAFFQAPLRRIQNALFQLGAELATPPEKAENLGKSIALIEASEIEDLEKGIDSLEEGLPLLKTFILPGGSPVGAHFHLARTICRRAERAVVALTEEEKIRPEVLQYLNRLSDLLFTMARKANHTQGADETPWDPVR